MYKYFISFSYSNNNGINFGNGIYELRTPITSIENIKEVEKDIETYFVKKRMSFPSVIILNYRRIFDD